MTLPTTDSTPLCFPPSQTCLSRANISPPVYGRAWGSVSVNNKAVSGVALSLCPGWRTPVSAVAIHHLQGGRDNMATAWRQGVLGVNLRHFVRNNRDLVKSSVSVSAQDGIVALGKAHTRSAPSLSSLPKVTLETVPIFAWLNTDRSRPWRVECWLLPFSTPLSFRRSML